jgi:hypothetical protein
MNRLPHIFLNKNTSDMVEISLHFTGVINICQDWNVYKRVQHSYLHENKLFSNKLCFCYLKNKKNPWKIDETIGRDTTARQKHYYKDKS